MKTRKGRKSRLKKTKSKYNKQLTITNMADTDPNISNNCFKF